MKTRLTTISTVLWLTLSALAVHPASAQDGYLANVNDKGMILDGYDVVAFFTQKKAVPGDQQYQTAYDGALYYFSSKDNMNRFVENPNKYVPQYGGFCAVAMSMGHLQPINVEQFEVVDRKLYLQRNAKAAGMWRKMGPKMVISKANENWPKIHETHGSFLTSAQLNDNLELIASRPARWGDPAPRPSRWHGMSAL